MSCPVCLNPVTAPALSGTDLLFESTSKTFTLHSCEACRCLFLYPMPDNAEIARFYPADYWWNARKSGTLKKLESIYRKFALRDHIHVTGVDFSAEAAKIAKIENAVDVAVGSLEDVQFPDQAFDIVTLFHVMEHVSNPRAVLAEVARVLRPAGAAILQVPNIESWQFKIFGARWYGLDIPRHVIDYSRNSILKLLADSGFAVTRIRHFNLRDNAPALISSIFPSLDPVSRSVRHRKRNVRESRPVEWFRHLAYLLLVTCAYPVVLLESAFGRGATVMIEAKKK